MKMCGDGKQSNIALLQVSIDILKCIIFTEVSMLGSFIMFTYPWSLEIGMVIWGAVIALMCAMLWAWGGLFGKADNDITMVFPVAILNAIGVNMGGYLVLMLVLKMPIAGVVYV